MSHTPATNDEPEAGDQELRRLLREAWPEPDPSPGFVENTLLRMSVHTLTTPEPNPGYVDRVLAAVAADRHRLASARVWQWRLAAGALAAAALLVALLPLGNRTASLPPPWPSTLQPSGFPAQGALPVGRSVALVRAATPTAVVGRNGSLRQDRRPAPTTFFPPPPPVLVEAGLLSEPEPWTSR